MGLLTAGLGNSPPGLLTLGLAFGAVAEPVIPVVPGVMPSAVATDDAALLAFIASRSKSAAAFAYVASYNRRPRSLHTAEQFPALLIYPDTANDASQPNPGDSLRVLRFSAVILEADTEDSEAGPKAIKLADAFRDAFNADRSFGGRCVAYLSSLSDGMHDDQAHPTYAIEMTGQVAYPKTRRGA